MPYANISLNQPSAAVLLAMINQDNHRTFIASDLTFGDPSIGATPTETIVSITPGPSSGLTGVIPYKYQRLNIATYFLGATPVLYISGTPTSALALAALLNQYQIYNASDVHNSFVATIAADHNSCTITPGPKNFVWMGTLTAQINERPLLSTLIQNTTFPGFSLPSNLDSNTPIAQVYYGLVNGTSMVNELQTLHSGFNFSQYLNTWPIGATLLNEPWYVNQSPGPYNLYGSIVEYNGLAVGNYVVPTSIGNWPGWVLVINLGPACTNRCGKLIFVYQPPDQSAGVPPPSPSPPDGNLIFN